MTKTTRHSRRPQRFFAYSVVVILLAFILALVPAETVLVLPIIRFIVALGIFLLSLLTYLYAVIYQNGSVMFALLVAVSGAFVLSAALWFMNPDTSRLEPLATLLALNAAFLGFMTSSTGRGKLELDLRIRDEDTVSINVRLNLKRDEDATIQGEEA